MKLTQDRNKLIEQFFELVLILKWSASDVQNCSTQIQTLIGRLARQVGLSKEQVIIIALRRFLAVIISTKEFENWEEFSLKRIQFCALITEAASAAQEFTEQVLEVCECTLQVTRDYRTRYDSLEMLFHFVSTISTMEPFSQRLVDLCLLGMKWRPGRANEAIRRAACLTLSKALVQEIVGKDALLHSTEKLLPVLKGCVEEDRSVQLRVCSLQLLKIYFAKLQDDVDSKVIFELYPLVLSRLDDSDDEVRIFAVDVFAQISACKHFKFSENTGTYISEQLLLHMDDPNPILRERIFCLLKFLLLEKSYEQVRKLAKEKTEVSNFKELCLKLVDAQSTEKL